jgi:hypothetical protein
VLLSGAAGPATALLPAIPAGRIDIPRTLHEEVVWASIPGDVVIRAGHR